MARLIIVRVTLWGATRSPPTVTSVSISRKAPQTTSWRETCALTSLTTFPVASASKEITISSGSTSCGKRSFIPLIKNVSIPLVEHFALWVTCLLDLKLNQDIAASWGRKQRLPPALEGRFRLHSIPASHEAHKMGCHLDPCTHPILQKQQCDWLPWHMRSYRRSGCRWLLARTRKRCEHYLVTKGANKVRIEILRNHVEEPKPAVP